MRTAFVAQIYYDLLGSNESMDQTAHRTGVVAPHIYMIKWQDRHTVVAMQMNDRYLFNIESQWRSVSTKAIDPMVQAISEEVVSKVKQQIQSASKLAVRLLLLGKQLFGTVHHGFDSLELPSVAPINIDTSAHGVSICSDKFIPLTIEDIKYDRLPIRSPWKTIYIDSVLRARGLPPTLDCWTVVISPVQYIFGESKESAMSIRLMQLHRAIIQLQCDDLTTAHISQLSQELDHSIERANFRLPDLCVHLCQTKWEPLVDRDNLVREGLLLICKLARLGIANNCTEISNMGTIASGINFKSYDDAVLAEIHGVPFEFDRATSIFSSVYRTTRDISSDPMLVFNCLVMYNVIQLMTSIWRNHSDDRAKQIIVDANGIMKQVYGGATFSCQGKPYAAAEWLHTKHFGTLPEFKQFVVSKTYDADKYSYLSAYAREFDFGAKKVELKCEQGFMPKLEQE